MTARKISKKLKLVYNLLIDWVCASFVFGPKSKIAIIKLDAIGDFLLWLHAAKSLSEHFGKENVKLIVSSRNFELASQFPYWSDIISIDTVAFVNSRSYRSMVIRDVRKNNFMTSIHCCHSRIFDIGDAIVRATRSSIRIGSEGDHSNISKFKKKISDRWYTSLIPSFSSHKHEALRHEEFLNGIGLSSYKANILDISGDEWLERKSLKFNGLQRNYFLIFPGASWSGRQWETFKFAALIRRLQTLTNLQCVLCGGSSEIQLSEHIASMCGSEVNLIDLTGKVSLDLMLKLIRDAEFLVGNETSCIHASAVVRTPCVCILGGGHFGRFVPYPADCDESLMIKPVASKNEVCFGCNWQCSRNEQDQVPMPCISEIDVNSVFNACETLWINIKKKIAK